MKKKSFYTFHNTMDNWILKSHLVYRYNTFKIALIWHSFFSFNSLRIQSLLNMKLYKLKKNDTLKLKRVIEDYNKVHENRVSVNAKNHNFKCKSKMRIPLINAQIPQLLLVECNIHYIKHGSCCIWHYRVWSLSHHQPRPSATPPHLIRTAGAAA